MTDPGGLVGLLVSVCILLDFQAGARPPRGERPEIHLTDTVGDATSLHSLKPKPGKGGGSAGQRRPLLPNSGRYRSV